MLGTMYTCYSPAQRDELLRLLYYIEYREKLPMPSSLIKTYIFFVHHRRFLVNLTSHCRTKQLFIDELTDSYDDQEFCLDGFWVDCHQGEHHKQVSQLP